MLQSHVFDQFLETWMFLSFLVECSAQQPEVMSHNQIPLLQLVKHLNLLNFKPFVLINTIIITKQYIFLHLQHCKDLSIFESSIRISQMLVIKIGIFVHSNEWASSQIEIFNHQLSKSIIWIVHLVIKDKGKVKLILYV